MGHYVWKCTAKRYRYSHEEGMSNLDLKSRDNEYLGAAGEKGNNIVAETRSVYHMFLEDDKMVSENDEALTDESGAEIDVLNGFHTTKVEHTKVYDYDNSEESKKNFDLNKRLANVYKDPGASILSNDLF